MGVWVPCYIQEGGRGCPFFIQAVVRGTPILSKRVVECTPISSKGLFGPQYVQQLRIEISLEAPLRSRPSVHITAGPKTDHPTKMKINFDAPQLLPQILCNNNM